MSNTMEKNFFTLITLLLLIASCNNTSSQLPSHDYTFSPTAGPTPTLSSQESKIPVFDHILMIMFENRDYQQVIGNQEMPTFNQLAAENVLLTNYYAAAHPSLPNYIALIGGDTFGITSNCTDCFLNHTSLPDLIEASGRSWKTYQEALPTPCFIGSSGEYVQKHDPFIYFDPIRSNTERCKNRIVSLKSLDADLASNQLPNFVFIMPDLCNSAHDCGVNVADTWLGLMMNELQKSPALGQRYFIYIAFEESAGDNSSCCGMPAKAGGKVAAILISPQAKNDFKDDSPLDDYSLLKTILISWRLPLLGFASDPETQAITTPWK